MSASRMPTERPLALRPSARLTAVVDLPTPPLPLATAMIAPTPGTPALPGGAWRRGCGAIGAPVGGAAGGSGRALARADGDWTGASAVSTTIADVTPGSATTALSAALRTGSI